ncbi:TetR/AcrR family transcriptional regulator [Williamsia sterculiae]|uniref:Transcriptional regulator, TetR family n=1 Tax=Williamsia sterculiae TaxID=1344003 RepID=A0A1N7GWU2_9NOCA|nr:TetR/AcrR family transcriptional regulator [Williamsia sterculiae]SIS17016.1 transcriptional regulator, TetR family [Williamsia sterculiae]
MSDSPPAHRRGRAFAEGVLSAAANELLNTGFDGFTIANVAEKAGVHVTSIYRRWRTKEQLVIDALLSSVEPTIPVPDTGSVRADLVELTLNLYASITSPQSKALLRLATMPLDFDRLDEARGRMVDDRSAAMEVVFERAVRRGEIGDTVDPRLALELLHSPIYSRVLITHEPVDDAFVTDLVDLALHGLAPDANTRTRPRIRGAASE